MDYTLFWPGACRVILEQADKGGGVAWWLIPLFSAVLAVGGSWVAIAFDRRKAVNQELVKKRLELYATYVPMANDVYCFMMTIGHFRKLTPDDMLDRKRDLDRFRHLYGPLFAGHELVDAYDAFIGDSFATFGGSGQPAKIRANPSRLAKQYGAAWNAGWNGSFDPANEPDGRAYIAHYDAFVLAFAKQVGASRA